MRRIAAVIVLKPIPYHFGIKPWHQPVLELHLLGVERSQFQDSHIRYTYYAIAVEPMARKLGLVSVISLN